MAHLNATSHPIEFFDMFISESFRHKTILDHSNANAWKNRAGSVVYPNCTPFLEDEIDKYIGLLIRNGLNPVPDMRLNWSNPLESFVYGDERVQRLFPRGVQRYKELRAFIHVSDPYAKPAKDKPFIKIQDIIDHVISNSKENWVLGRYLSLDEIDIGFQGRFAHKDKIKYKGEGDGILLDAICDRGYFYVGHFRHSPCPIVEKNASPLHNRCLYLVEQCNAACPQTWNTLFFDNLFTSKNFMDWLYARNRFGAGVCRTSGRGLPACVVQDVAKKKAELEAAVGTVKVARSSDYKVLAFSVYDAKPVHFMTSLHTSVKHVEKTRQIFDALAQQKVEIQYKRINVIDDYNYNMNGVDRCDQMRNQYRYSAVCKKANVEKPLAHRLFNEAVASRLCNMESFKALRLSMDSSTGSKREVVLLNCLARNGGFRGTH
ncbi:hypothetical protein CYMTET_43012 [Cymbomonas tetramitiformis]|uniref:PiggyBac transposable element-derived protein domain-containing protein n=1 Tax=Cymbomonas tetramitiformis TaxID=36881 RepID=A0AAE0F128_9CHLO|nr:hypothetical protein CYMTET_43012 [Cymbomonas tetramitiformis]